MAACFRKQRKQTDVGLVSPSTLDEFSSIVKTVEFDRDDEHNTSFVSALTHDSASSPMKPQPNSYVKRNSRSERKPPVRIAAHNKQEADVIVRELPPRPFTPSRKKSPESPMDVRLLPPHLSPSRNRKERGPPVSPSSLASLAQILDSSFISDAPSQKTLPARNSEYSLLGSLVCLNVLEIQRPARDTPRTLVKASIRRHFQFYWPRLGNNNRNEAAAPFLDKQDWMGALNVYKSQLIRQKHAAQRPETLRKLVVLCLALDQLEPALQYSTEALEFYREQQRPLQAALSAMELGLALFALNQMDKALKSWREAVQLACLAVGYEHMHVAVLLCNIGVLHLEMGEIASGLRALEESLDLQRVMLREAVTFLDACLFRMATTMCNLAWALYNDRQYDRAVALLDESHAVFGSILSSATDEMRSLVQYTAMVFARDRGISQGGFKDDASQLTSASLDSARSDALLGYCNGIPDRRVVMQLSRLGTDNHDLLVLGPLRREQTPAERVRVTVDAWFGKSAENGTSSFTAYEDFKHKNYPHRNESITADLDNHQEPNAELKFRKIYYQATRHVNRNEIGDALELFRSFLRSHRAKYGDVHHLVGTALHNIGMVHLFSNQYTDALAAFNEAILIRRASLGPDHPDVQASMMKIGLIRYAWAEFYVAQNIFSGIRDKFMEVLGHGHPQMAKIMNNIGIVACQLNDYSTAYSSLEKAYDYQRRFAQEKNDQSEILMQGMANSLSNMAFIRFKQGNSEEARRLYERAISLLEQARQRDDAMIGMVKKNITYIERQTSMMRLPSLTDQFRRDIKAVQGYANNGIIEDGTEGPESSKASLGACNFENPFAILEDMYDQLKKYNNI